MLAAAELKRHLQMPTFLALTPQQQRILFTIAEARESGRLPRDSFGVEQRDGRLQISAPEEISVEGDIQDLFPIKEAGYLSVREIHSTNLRGSPTIDWAVALTGHGMAYYHWHHLSGSQRTIADLRPTAEDMRKLIYSPALVGGIAGAINGALSGWLGQRFADGIAELGRRLAGG
jgi:hypothetical protein